MPRFWQRQNRILGWRHHGQSNWRFQTPAHQSLYLSRFRRLCTVTFFNCKWVSSGTFCSSGTSYWANCRSAMTSLPFGILGLPGFGLKARMIWQNFVWTTCPPLERPPKFNRPTGFLGSWCSLDNCAWWLISLYWTQSMLLAICRLPSLYMESITTEGTEVTMYWTLHSGLEMPSLVLTANISLEGESRLDSFG
jgi:hypothetical protein